MAAQESKILMVDDDASDLADIQRALESLNCELVSVKDPHEVIPRVHSERPDVVILDALLPGLSGFDLCKQIKTDAEIKGTLVVILTGVYLRQQYRQEALHQFKADGFVTKPFRTPELQRLVVQLLAKKTRRPPSGFLQRLGLPAPASRKGIFDRLFGRGKGGETEELPVPSASNPLIASTAPASRTDVADDPALAEEKLDPQPVTEPPVTSPTEATSETSAETAQFRAEDAAAEPEPTPAPTPEPEGSGTGAPEPAAAESSDAPEAERAAPEPGPLPEGELQRVSAEEPSPAPEPEPVTTDEPQPEPTSEIGPVIAEALTSETRSEPETVVAESLGPTPEPLTPAKPEAETVVAKEVGARVRAVEAEEVDWIEHQAPPPSAPITAGDLTLPGVSMPASKAVATEASPPAPAPAPVGEPTPPEERGSAFPLDQAPRKLRRAARRYGDVPIYGEEDFHFELKREISKCRRVDRPLTLILIRIADLPQIIELIGKNAVEAVLWHVAEQATASLREVDLVGMMSSEHLIALTAFASDRYGGGRVVKRMKKGLKKNPFRIEDELPPLVPKLQFGMATYPEDANDVVTLMERAYREMSR